MDFYQDVQNFENQLLTEFHQYQQQIQQQQENFHDQYQQINHYHQDLAARLTHVMANVDHNEFKTQGLQLINTANTTLQSHLQRQMHRLETEFEQTREEYRQRARGLY